MVFLFMECKTRNERLQEVCINFGLMVVNKSLAILNLGGPGSAVGIATGYGLDGPGDRIPVVARFSATVQTGPRAHPASLTMGTGSFPGVKGGRGVTLTPHPFWCRGQERVELYLY